MYIQSDNVLGYHVSEQNNARFIDTATDKCRNEIMARQFVAENKAGFYFIIKGN